MDATAAIDGNNVSVTGFNFSENYVGTVTNNGSVTYRGHKLVIRFSVKLSPAFWAATMSPPTPGPASMKTKTPRPLSGSSPSPR